MFTQNIIILVLCLVLGASAYSYGPYPPPPPPPTSYPYNPYQSGPYQPNPYQPTVHDTTQYAMQSDDEMGMQILFFSRKNNKTAYVITKAGGMDIWKGSNYNANNPTKFIVHGFADTAWAVWMRKMKDEYLAAGDYNVILIDWTGGAGRPYGQAVANTKMLGIVIAKVTEDLKIVFGTKYSDVHVIGHSLGAHIAGIAGSRLNGTIGRISALDPSGPSYDGQTNNPGKLSYTNAQFVDVIHTDSCPITGMGTIETLGHVDFFPNDGTDQPGCPNNQPSDIYGPGRCNTARSIELFTASISNANPKGVAYQCTDYLTFRSGRCSYSRSASGLNYAFIGEPAIITSAYTKNSPGNKYYLTTGATYPYFNNN